MASDEHYIETAQGRIYVEFEGDPAAELVILATGGPGISHDHYNPWFSRLGPEFRVAYLDYIGCGRSDRLDDPRAYSVELFAGNLEELRRFAGADTVSVIGISFGGLPALEYALGHQGRVRRLVLSNAQVSAAGWQRGNIDGVNAELERLFPDEWQQLMELRSEGVLSLDPRYQELVGRVLADLEWVDPWDHPPLKRPDQGGGVSLDVYEAVVGEDPEWTVSGTLAGYDRSADLHLLPPALVVTGRYDRLTPPALAYETYDLLDASTRQLHVLERSAHRPWVEQPDEYFRVVKSFLGS